MLQEARSLLWGTILVGLLFFLGFLYTQLMIFVILGFISIALLLFVLYFFRSPDRKLPEDANAILAPADGRIVAIDTIREDKYLYEEVTRVSIFLSIFNVHVNRIPVDGIIDYLHYQKGTFKAAFNHRASMDNEQHAIGIKHKDYKILFTQIAGLIARRIVSSLSLGQDVKKGEIFGMIKFGSRCDVFLPKEAQLLVKNNDKVKAGESILAEVT